MASEQGFATVSPDLLESAYRLIRAGAAKNRSDLSEKLGVSTSTASNIARSLVSQERVREVEPASHARGRRSTQLESIAPPVLVAAAEIGTSHVRYALSDRVGPIVEAQEVPIDLTPGPRPVLERLVELWRELRDREFPGADILAAGIAVPGPVDASTRRIVLPSRMPGWHDADVRAIVAELADVDCVVENDARAAALGEASVRGPEHQPLLYIKAGSGIGGALVIDGKIYTGGMGIAGDVSHARVVEDSPFVCGCGKSGCLETVASGAAIRRDAAPFMELGSMAELVEAGQNQFPHITQLIRNSGMLVGKALGPLISFVNPCDVVVGGAMSELTAFMNAFRVSLLGSAVPMATERLRIEAASLGANSALTGIARSAHDLVVSAPVQ
ncbi:ROK family transcriptional regulator [Trueperella sp.]|uniref:ROK family transcriptional regulator n=1 Tax=Trueperella sp. TaxID=2699835 RepID=UPI00261A8735|nr:ROK family transcriptional regulator [Trueperella sp.]